MISGRTRTICLPALKACPQTKFKMTYLINIKLSKSLCLPLHNSDVPKILLRANYPAKKIFLASALARSSLSWNVWELQRTW